MPQIKTALISLSDKSGILPFAQFLQDKGVKILSTGGTARTLKEGGITVTDVSDHTGFPEIMDGRVKTLHPKVHGGLLALRDNPEHMATLAKHDITPIDMLVVNLYPFEATIAKEGVTFSEAIENIDIGGPCMLRAAAKNFSGVAVVTEPEDYEVIMEELKNNDMTLSEARRKELAIKVFKKTSAYDGMIFEYLSKN